LIVDVGGGELNKLGVELNQFFIPCVRDGFDQKFRHAAAAAAAAKTKDNSFLISLARFNDDPRQ
jgi:hypothetical protein